MAKLVVYANPSDNAIKMAPDDVEINYLSGDEGDSHQDFELGSWPSENVENLLPPNILTDSFVTTVKTLADGSVVADVEFEISEVPQATAYEIRYT